MRVIAGVWRGRRIQAPPGRTTRPTSDRVREAVFSAIESRIGRWQGVRAVDLYAGSGALGIEALSRGASHVVFVENDRKAAGFIRRNLSALGVGDDRAVVLTERAESGLCGQFPGHPASLLFADPPYRIDAAQVVGVFQAHAEAGVIRPGALVVYEHAAGVSPSWPDGFTPEEPRRYGDTAVSFARYEA